MASQATDALADASKTARCCPCDVPLHLEYPFTSDKLAATWLFLQRNNILATAQRHPAWPASPHQALIVLAVIIMTGLAALANPAESDLDFFHITRGRFGGKPVYRNQHFIFGFIKAFGI